MTKASLLANTKDNIDLLLTPLKGGDTINEATIKGLIQASEFTALFVNAANIKNALAELDSVLKPLEEGQSGREIRYEILTRKDATITIQIGSEEMSAEAEITSAMGGAHLTAKAILDAAKAAGVKKGFSKEDLLKLAHMAAKAEPGTLVKHAIAAGREAVNGKDARIKPLVQSAQERILRPKKQEDGRVDMRDLGDIICVRIGEPLAKKIPLTQGIKGYTVTATPLLPEPGQDALLTPGEGTVVSPKNENVLISTKVGLPKIIDNGMEVDEIYKISNVDVGSGHIDFQGSVIIDGDVNEGMKVKATGDITIGGFVESAQLTAGGDITIASGIIGKKQDLDGQDSDIRDFKMSATIRAVGNLFAKYCQYADIQCNGNIRIENQLMHSLIDVGGVLWVGEEDKANGKLIGGLVSASSSIHAGIVGATAGSKTLINFEKPLAEFVQQLSEIDERFATEDETTTELQAATKKLKKLPQNEQTKAMLQKVVTTYQFHAKQMGEILLEKEQLETQQQAFMTSVYLEATEKLYQSVEIAIGEFQERTKREFPASKMRYKDRKIIIDPIV
ncbi:DUF342 domain-containing protein [Thalassotalea euphylliae]|uniref:DUF342 domain-containing protein n=1 Tax=Thalassotalea euphylliae TaxID=1655234 RepID=A0A3E0TV85_9GAMM|nr:FapA family protein [Thalassotalea euphylliae]REL27845.1 DUF342 domain-containing protein [Thalassotalea euphylliae]